jgi:isochorismate pyruvate lyase
MTLPEDCTNLEEVRIEIDELDYQIIVALGERYKYVRVASKFKNREADVPAPERLSEMLGQRRQWAESAGLNPDVIEKIYRDLVDYFIDEELQHWRSQS